LGVGVGCSALACGFDRLKNDLILSRTVMVHLLYYARSFLQI
jgi:hypothetical protein